MPLYEYHCEACGKRFEVIRKFSDPELTVCALCGTGPVQRLPSSPAIQFKGSGWYITDYASKGKSGTDATSSIGGDTKAAEPASAAGATKTESAPTPAKPASTEKS